jgi:ubiquinone/menaquinone biosynthesis C-methylase UbiE
MMAKGENNVDEHAQGGYQLEGTGAELYEKILVPPLLDPWADELITRVSPKQGDEVLDVGTGTGIVARKVAARVGPAGAVTGLDPNPAMLEVAKRAAVPSEPTIEWIEGNVVDLSLSDRTYHIVFCQQVMQFLPNRPQATNEIFRVLAPGGRVAISSWRSVDHNPYAAAFANVVMSRVSVEAGQETLAPFNWDDGEELEALLDTAGFGDVQVESITMNMKGLRDAELRVFIINDLLAYPITGRAIDSWSSEQKNAMVDEIVTALAAYETGGLWSIPWTAYVATGTK